MFCNYPKIKIYNHNKFRSILPYWRRARLTNTPKIFVVPSAHNNKGIKFKDWKPRDGALTVLSQSHITINSLPALEGALLIPLINVL